MARFGAQSSEKLPKRVKAERLLDPLEAAIHRRPPLKMDVSSIHQYGAHRGSQRADCPEEIQARPPVGARIDHDHVDVPELALSNGPTRVDGRSDLDALFLGEAGDRRQVGGVRVDDKQPYLCIHRSCR